MLPTLSKRMKQQNRLGKVDSVIGLGLFVLLAFWLVFGSNDLSGIEASPDFPITEVLDNFNRGNGSIGANWSGDTGNYSINSNQLDVGSTGDIYWTNGSFGANQEVFVTLSTVDTNATEIDLVLKGQGTNYEDGVLAVLYDPGNEIVQVWTNTPNVGWESYGNNIAVIFEDGDRFGARAMADGTVEVYRNDTLIATRDVSGWAHADEGGYIGLWFEGASNMLVDDFGGGTVVMPTPTPTVPGPTSTPTAIPTATPTSMPGVTFPASVVLDNFNRSNGDVGSNWSGTTGSYSLNDDELNIDSDGDIYWNTTLFGADQEVFITLTTIDEGAQEIDLLLKAQSSSEWDDGVLEVWYDVSNDRVQVWTFTSAQDWVQHGSDIAVSFSDGDRFGARATAEGVVEVYQNDTLLATRDVSSWPYANSGGYIGLWFIGAEDMVLDDFGGGTMADPPQASFTGNPITGTVPLTVSFSNTSVNATSYLWHFGDGITSTLTAPSHVYEDAGVYTVALTANGLGGTDTLTRTNYITVTGAMTVTANFTATPLTAPVPLTVTFTNLSTGATSYVWDFGDGVTSTLAAPVHTYLESGIYTVRLTATDSTASDVLIRSNYIRATNIITPTFVFGWSDEGEQANANFGQRTVSAGDVNGDGFADILVSAPFYDGSSTDTGQVNLYLGSNNGLSATVAWSLTGSNQHDRLGRGISSAGDVNGDGYDDVLVGIPSYTQASPARPGRVLLFYGSSSGLTGTPDVTLEGVHNADTFGTSVARAGDVNGDGYDDIIVGSVTYDNAETDEGRLYLFYGSSSGLVTTPAWTYESNQASAWLGRMVSTAGDVNGDGYADVMANAPRYDNGQTDEGIVWVFYGSANGPSSTPDWSVESNQANGQIGEDLGLNTAGDVNGDGYDDVLIGRYNYSNGEASEGLVSLYYGSASGLSTTADWTYESNQATATLGWSVGPAGDVNRDGYADFLVGADEYNTVVNNGGRAFLFYGDASGPAGTPDWTLSGAQANSSMGQAVASAGDVNGDGTVDLLLGQQFYTGLATEGGRAVVYYTTIGITRTWEVISTTLSPPVWGEYGLAYDRGRAQTVLYGGNAEGWPYENTTWEFDGSDWITVTLTQTVSAVYGMALTYDANREMVVLFGGSDANDNALAETWEYDGIAWTQVVPTSSPPARTGHTLMYDPITEKVYLFGGRDGDTYYNDLWQYDGTTWTQLTPSQSPSARAYHALAYNPADNNLILFGGQTVSDTLPADLWLYDPPTNTWIEIDTTGPVGRVAPSFVYDVQLGVLVLAGGAVDEGDTWLNDTWHFNLQTGWLEAEPVSDLPPGAYHQAVFDLFNDAILLVTDGQTWSYR